MSEEKTIIKQLNQDEIRDFILKKDYEIYKYKEVLDKIKETINHYATEDEDYSKIYNQEEQEILELLEDLDE